MKIIRGCHRVVFVFNNIVIKIPNFYYSFEHFLNGMLANMKEGRIWYQCKESNDIELICPVIWYSWGGWVLIMAKADVCKWNNEIRLMPAIENPSDFMSVKENNNKLYKKWIDAGFGGDDKADNYGYFNGNLVKIDYG